MSLPINPAPMTVVFLSLFIGINLLSLVVDFSSSDVLRVELYAAKAASVYFKVFNVVMLGLGLLTYTLNGVFALTRASPGLRRISDIAGTIIFYAGVYIAITILMPAEKAFAVGKSAEILRQFRLISIGLQIAQAMQQWISFKNQGAIKLKPN